MRDGKKKSASADNPLLTQYRETIKLMQEACAPLIVLAKGRRPPKLQVKPESSKSASSQSGSAITARKNGSGSQVSKQVVRLTAMATQ